MPEDLFRPQLGEPHHYAYVVEDIEATVNRLADQLGAGPFFLVEGVSLVNVLSRGEPAEFVHNSAFGSCGGGAIELMEAVSLAPERVEKGFSGPRPGIQHVAYAVPPTEVADLRSSLDELGLSQYLSAQLGEVDMTFHDASAVLGHDIEIHVDCEGLRDFFEMVSGGRRGLGWLGTAAPGRELMAGSGHARPEARSEMVCSLGSFGPQGPGSVTDVSRSSARKGGSRRRCRRRRRGSVRRAGRRAAPRRSRPSTPSPKMSIVNAVPGSYSGGR